jgi:hypothetical protein
VFPRSGLVGERRFEMRLILLVGAAGFEPAAPCAQGRCATRLRYAPTQRLSHTPRRCTIASMSFERIAEFRLRQAIDDGLLDDLPNRGERLDLDEYFATPEDHRVAYSILKNANCLPEEVEIRNEIGALQRAQGRTASSDERRALQQRIADLTLRLDLLRERRRR